MRKNTIVIFSILAALALLPRILLAVSSSAGLTGDECTYNSLASSIISGKGFSIGGKVSTYFPPLYPYFLALIYKLFGHSLINIRLAQAFLGSASCILLYLLGKKLFNQKCAIIAFLLTAFNPAMIKSCERLRSECLFIVLLISAVLILVEIYKKTRTSFLALLGVSMGLATLTRGIFILFPLFFIASLFFIKNKKESIKYSVITILFFALTLAPWTIRNWLILDAFVPVSTQSGLAFYSSFNPKESNIYGFNVKDKITEEADKLESELARSNFLISRTFKSIKTNPLDLPRIELLKFLYFWCPFDWEIIEEGRYNFIYGFIFPFFAAGIILTIRNFREYMPLYLPLIYFQFMALIFYGSPRFRLPIEPILALFAASVFPYLKKTKHKQIFTFATIAYLIINISIFFNSDSIKYLFKNTLFKIGLYI